MKVPAFKLRGFVSAEQVTKNGTNKPPNDHTLPSLLRVGYAFVSCLMATMKIANDQVV